MLTIKCAYCKTKLFKYLKIGMGKVLRCHKSRISRVYNKPVIKEDKVYCPNCGGEFAKDEGKYFSMIREGFTYTGTKQKK